MLLQLSAQRLQCAVQMAFDCVDGHVHDPADFGRIEVFLVAKGDDGALGVGQLGDQLAKPAVAKRIGVPLDGAQLAGVVEADGFQFRAAGLVDAAPRRDLPQPEEQV
jgi:hypothetical protein